MNSFLIAMIGGVAGFIVVLFGVLTGLRVIKVKLNVHKTIGIAVLAIAVLHGSWAALLYFGVF